MPRSRRLLHRAGALACLLALCGCALLRPEQPSPELRRMAGQMLLVGFRGAEPGLDPPGPLPIMGQIKALNLGGVILFDRDAALHSPQRNVTSPEQLARLTRALQAAAGEA
ncbi:MAG: glycoside hydrolase family 3, partial [Proteobacteria bacterium]|nr:glycoside hydrolase family 3 [Pseudomonadota bacterium]MBU1594019.1 glycoside hydrolase family 3 [Pseudomonadota bacterium]